MVQGLQRTAASNAMSKNTTSICSRTGLLFLLASPGVAAAATGGLLSSVLAT